MTSNNTSNDGPNKTTGQYHSVKGTVVETIGSLTGSKDWEESGRKEHAEGETEYNAAKAQGYVEGTVDRAGGYKDSVVGAITGDKSRQVEGNVRKEKGEKQQDVNDIS